jgi:hypothetical protein
MHEQPNIDDRLWDYIDGACSKEEKGFVEALIASQHEWRDKYHALLEMHQLMQQSLDLDEPSLSFSRNVMSAIALHKIAPAAKTYIDKRIIYGIGLFFMVMLAGFLLYGIGQINWSAGNGATGNLWSKIAAPKIEWRLLFNNTYMTIFMMINLVLGLMLLDMYLERKKKRMQTKGGDS